MAKAGRPKTVERKTTLSVSENLSGWLEFRGRQYSRGVSQYLCDLADKDRAKVLEYDSETAEKYRLFCQATGYDGELEKLDKGV